MTPAVLTARIVTATLIVATLGCSPKAENGIIPDELLANQRKWESASRGSYTFSVRHSCECQWIPMRISVTRGTANSVTVSDSLRLSESERESLSLPPPTIDTFFELLSDAYRKNYPDVYVEYDEFLGYPRRFFINPNAAIKDDEMQTEVFDLVLTHVG